MVSILIPVYNGENVIESCLDSVLASEFKNYEILILDDSSTDKSTERVQRYLSSRISLFKSHKNRGFVKNISRGISKARGEVIVLLNMDTVVDSNWLGELVKPLYELPEIAMTGSKIYYMDGVTMQHAGAYLDGIARSYHIGRGEIDQGQYDDYRDVEYVCGASLAFRKDILNKLGGFDRLYSPVYYEEVDFAFRLKKAGYRVMYVPTSKLKHYECYSVALCNKPFFYYISKNRITFVLKHFSIKRLISDFISREIRFFLDNDMKNRKDLLRAYLHVFCIMPAILFARLKLKRIIRCF